MIKSNFFLPDAPVTNRPTRDAVENSQKEAMSWGGTDQALPHYLDLLNA